MDTLFMDECLTWSNIAALHAAPQKEIICITIKYWRFIDATVFSPDRDDQPVISADGKTLTTKHWRFGFDGYQDMHLVAVYTDPVTGQETSVDGGYCAERHEEWKLHFTSQPVPSVADTNPMHCYDYLDAQFAITKVIFDNPSQRTFREDVNTFDDLGHRSFVQCFSDGEVTYRNDGRMLNDATDWQFFAGTVDVSVENASWAVFCHFVEDVERLGSYNKEITLVTLRTDLQSLVDDLNDFLESCDFCSFEDTMAAFQADVS